MRKAVIDIGTNSCRLFIADTRDNKIEKNIIKCLEVTELGKGLEKTGVISDQGISNLLKALSKYKSIIKDKKCDLLKICATSASRDAKNGTLIMNEIEKLMGVVPKIIEGTKEANLTYSGIAIDFNSDILAIDIGGGSTEFILGRDSKPTFAKSLNIGAVRYRDLFTKDNIFNVEKAKEYTYSLFEEHLSHLKNKEFDLVGTAGTLTTQVTVYEELTDYITDVIHKYNLSKEKVISNLNLYESKSVEKRAEIVGLHPKRAKVIIEGTYILLWIMEYFNFSNIIVSESDILEGLVLDKEGFNDIL